MLYTRAFVSLINELERYQLPPRRRLLEGEAVGGRARAVISMDVAIVGATIPPTLCVTVAANVTMTMATRGRVTARKPSTIKASIDRVRAPKSPRNANRDRVVGPRPRRSQEATKAASAVLSAQRIRRIEAVMPLIEEARTNGCLLLREICAYLDNAGHRPPQGEKWNTATLMRMLPKRTEADRADRDAAFRSLFARARDDGAESLEAVANWMNLRGHRTAKGREWTKATVYAVQSSG